MRVLPALAVAVLVVASCGSDDDGGSDGDGADGGETASAVSVEAGAASVVVDGETSDGQATCGDDPAVVVDTASYTIAFSTGSADTESVIVVTDAEDNRVVSDPSTHEVAIEGIPSAGSFAGELSDGRSVEVVFACE